MKSTVVCFLMMCVSIFVSLELFRMNGALRKELETKNKEFQKTGIRKELRYVEEKQESILIEEDPSVRDLPSGTRILIYPSGRVKFITPRGPYNPLRPYEEGKQRQRLPLISSPASGVPGAGIFLQIGRECVWENTYPC